MAGIDDAYARVMKDPSIQFKWPPPVEQPPVPPTLGMTPGMAQALFWTVVAIGVAAVALVVITQIRDRIGKPRTAGSAGVKAPTPAAIPLPAKGLLDADALAALGQYGAAVHALLLSGIGAIERQFPRTLRPASTSRDIARLPVLPEPMRDAFATMAVATERAVFAGRALMQDDWERCRAGYAALTDRR